MSKLTFVLAIFMVAGATKINGEAESLRIPFPPVLGPLTPSDVPIAPRFLVRTPKDQINGRLLTPAEGCGHSPLGNNRIVGGSVAKTGAWPWMTLLGYRAPPLVALLTGTQATFNCGGSLITSKHVLTAAHCVLPDLWFARLGEHDVRTTRDGQHEDILITRGVPHPQWDKELVVNDVAVLTLQRDVIFSESVSTICLPLDPPVVSQSFVGKNPFSTGWGMTGENGQQSPVLKQVQVPVVDNKVCKEIFRKLDVLTSEEQISEMVVCAGGVLNQASCQGDSGGPLVLPVPERDGKSFPFYQIGIVSWGIPCGKRGIPTVYSSTQHFGKWIKSQLN